MGWLWQNGSKRLVMAALLFFSTMFVLVAITVALMLWPQAPEYAPLSIAEPLQVESPLSLSSGVFHATLTMCNTLKKDVPFTIQGTWQTMSSPFETALGRTGTSVRTPGCTNVDYLGRIPLGVTPGVWRVTWTYTTQRGSQVQSLVTQSNTVEVVP
jgi:hypothetical protein